MNLITGVAGAKWKDEGNNREYGGPAKKCKVLDDGNASELADLEYATFLRLARPGHAKVRDQLLEQGEGCAITGETTAAVLDLAHIIAAAGNGSAVSANCMLLRTDLHRLFDAGQLGFDREGKVCLTDSLSKRYREELADRRLDPQVFRRVKRALSQRPDGVG